MAFDIEMIKKVYQKYPKAVAAARKATNKPLTLAEKILYTHLWDGNATKAFTRGEDYVRFCTRQSSNARRYSSNGTFAIYASRKRVK